MDCIYITPKKDKYGPIVDALLKAAEKMGVAVEFDPKNLDKYEAVIAFSNRTKVIPKTKAKIGWWMCDLRDPNVVGDAPKIDATFLCNKTYLKDYQEAYKAPAYYMPQCGLDKPDEVGRKIEWDAVFIGKFSDSRYHINRFNILEHIKSKYEVKVIMNDGWTEDTKWIYAQSPFSLSISMPYDGYTSNRTYNILASRGFCLINYFPGIEDLFENRKHLAWFKTPEEAVEIMDYYYSHPEEYEAVKEAGYKLYQERHTAEARLKNMFDILHGKSGFYGYRN